LRGEKVVFFGVAQVIFQGLGGWPGNELITRAHEKQRAFGHRCTKTEKLDSFAIDFAFQGF